ncbi:MAG: hypothetical protein ACYDDO_08800 [Acidiferrobacterales bacterium]
MAAWKSWMIWPDNMLLSALVLVVIAIPFLYGARRPMHSIIRAITHIVSNPMRLAARWLMQSAQELRRRNQVVLLAHGREEVGQLIEREFERVDAVVKRDLQGYPALQRKLMDEITVIEEEYRKCGEVPPVPPEWTKAVAVIAKLKPSGDRMVEMILGDIQESVTKIHDKAIAEYRRAYETRHKILESFKPFWRSLNRTLSRVDRSLVGIQERAVIIDNQMQKYEEISNKTEQAEHTLAASGMIQFVISAFVLLVAVGGTVINFNLIALPMSEMVGGASYIGNFRTSDVAALVIILVEASMGLFLMESLRITRLFPRIGYMNDRMRHRMIVAALTFLLVLAGVEAVLALMRDRIASDNAALRESLVISQQHIKVAVSWIPTAGQMVLGFVLPFVLAFVAIPLESFIYSLRTVIGVVLVALIRSLAFTLRFFGTLVRQIGVTLTMAYDVLIFVPLLIERLVKGGGLGWPGRSAAAGDNDARPQPSRTDAMPGARSVEAAARDKRAEHIL